MATQIYASALTFIAPRALEPVGVPRLTIWGLRGLTALDPDLTVSVAGGRIILSQRQATLLSLPTPASATPDDWAKAATILAEAAWKASPGVRQAGTQGIVQAFFDEMFDHLDPYSRYVRPRAARADETARNGGVGIGLRLARGRAGAAIAGAVTPDGPAARAGVRPGDAILAIDGTPVAGRPLPALARRIAGEEGSSVRLRWRTARGIPREAAIARVPVPPRTVYSETLAGMLLVRITRFNRGTATGFAAPIEQAMASRTPPEGIVIDLRGDPGGLLDEAVTVADGLLEAGVVAQTSGRDPEASEIWRSTPGELAAGLPVVVLVDGRTASAAEILAAALADRGRAVVVGSVTFGKGLVQTLTRVPGGGELYVTWSQVLAPRGWPLQGLGVFPQICTSLGVPSVEHELAALDQGSQPLYPALVRSRTLRPPVPPAEELAVRGLCPPAVGQDLDLEVAHYLIFHPAAYAAALLPPLREPLAGRNLPAP
ncbi:MAG: PDZ domain-containing protein [Rhodospirillales bacterium]|nr:PDZ domain-containing protein [Rhodospirillales bacterium]